MESKKGEKGLFSPTAQGWEQKKGVRRREIRNSQKHGLLEKGTSGTSLADRGKSTQLKQKNTRKEFGREMALAILFG